MGRFQPGQSGNPKGRAPRVVEDARLSVVARLFDEKAEEKAILAMIAAVCENSDVAAFKALMERKHGRVKDVVEEKSEVTVRVVYAD